jgi:putative SOS response-associated peptidase YedK
MCGRFTLHSQPKELIELFELDELPEELHPRFNVAPSQSIAAIGLKANGIHRGLTFFKWGLIPAWAKSSKETIKPINAKAETVATSPMFRDSFKKKRCIIPADGFYEWKVEEDGKQPYHIRMKSRALFGFAGIWSEWKGDDESVKTAAIITSEPNEVARQVHNRMPVILSREAYAAWLDPKTPAEELKSLLVPYPADEMEAVPVSKLVNSPKNDVPECLNPEG